MQLQLENRNLAVQWPHAKYTRAIPAWTSQPASSNKSSIQVCPREAAARKSQRLSTKRLLQLLLERGNLLCTQKPIAMSSWMRSTRPIHSPNDMCVHALVAINVLLCFRATRRLVHFPFLWFEDLNRGMGSLHPRLRLLRIALGAGRGADSLGHAGGELGRCHGELDRCNGVGYGQTTSSHGQRRMM